MDLQVISKKNTKKTPNRKFKRQGVSKYQSKPSLEIDRLNEMEENSEEDIPFVELFGFDISLKPGKPRPLEMCKPDSNEDDIKQKLISEWISASCEDLTALSGVPLDTWDYDEEMKKIEKIERSLNEDLDSIEYYPVKNFNLESENTENRSVGNEFSIKSYEASGDSKAIQKQEFPKENKKKTKKLKKKGLKKRQSVPSIDKQDVDIIEYPVKNIILEEEDSRKLVIERIRVKKMFEVSSRMKMVVVGVNDPYRFWIATNFIEMKELMKEMQTFYRNHSVGDAIPVKCLQKNMYCVALLNGMYSRATIVELEKKSDSVKLFFIDFGQVSAQKPENIFPLTEDFVKLPAQAVRASIDGIQPPYKGTLWSDEACRIFENSLLLKEIRAEVVELDEYQNALKIKISAPINSVLVTNGHAIFNRVPQKDVDAAVETKLKEKIKDIPTFHDLENWKVPWNFESYLKIPK